MENSNKVESRLNFLKNHPILSWLIFIAVVLIAIASFKDALSSLFFSNSKDGHNAGSTVNFNVQNGGKIDNVIGGNQYNYYGDSIKKLTKVRDTVLN